MSSKDRIKSFLICKGEATNAQIAGLFEPGEPGSLSWAQRTRDLRKDFAKDGIELRCEQVTKGTYIYKLIRPNIVTEPSGQMAIKF